MAQLLKSHGYEVHGTLRRSSADNTWRLERLGLMGAIHLHDWHLADPQSIHAIVAGTRPDRIFHLAAESYTVDSMTHPSGTLAANLLGTAYLLEAARLTSSRSTVILAGSSEVYGRSKTPFIVDENSPHRPTNPYGISKSAVSQLAEVYREAHSMNVRVAILFNHESELRSRQFVTRKITHALAQRSALGATSILRLGNLGALRDWGSAKEYVRGIALLAEIEENRDVVFATGRRTTVENWLAVCADELGMRIVIEQSDESELVRNRDTGDVIAEVDPRYLRSDDTHTPSATAALAYRLLGWQAATTAEELARQMVRAEIQALTN